MKGIIFDVQRASFVDGPGLRTTVFFKGCDLRCGWCHNPESWSMKPCIMFFESRCTACGRCRSVCPNGAIGESFRIDRTKCTACGACAKACFSSARMLCGYEKDADELMSLILQDKPFYEPDGGVTFSGGECMLQADFLYEMLQRCRAEGIRTAVDTAGNVPWPAFERVLSLTDLFLYDIKCADPVKHMAGTGVSGKTILENLSDLLAVCPEKVVIRIPVIGGFNDSDDDMKKIFDLLSSHTRLSDIELLPYHRMGEGKHAALDDGFSFTARIPDPVFVDKWQKLFQSIIGH